MISFGFFIDWQLGIVLLWLLYRAALAGRIPVAAARAYLLSVAPVAGVVAGCKIETFHAVVAAPISLVESVAVSVAGSEDVAAFDWGVLYNMVAVVVALVWVVGSVVWIAGWRKGKSVEGVRLCGAMRGGVASSLFGCIAIDSGVKEAAVFDALLAHERAHVCCGHSWDMLYLCVLRSVLWINPVVWLLGRDLVRLHEAQADAAVIGSGLSPRHYIDMLLGAQIGSVGAAVPEPLTTVHYFSYLSVKTRIQMMTRTFPTRRTLWRLVAVLPVVGATLTLFSFTRTEVVLNPALTVPALPKPEAQKKPTSSKDAPIFDAEVMPKFQGKDINAFRTWVQSRIVYPKAAAEQGIHGRVNMTFVVEKDGSVTGVQVLRGVAKSIDSVAVNVIQSSPKWTPGLTKGKPVRIRYNMPVDFALK